MAERLEYPFGSIDVETAGRWLQLAPEDDGNVWMLNLMKYRAVADYGAEGGPALSARRPTTSTHRRPYWPTWAPPSHSSATSPTR